MKKILGDNYNKEQKQTEEIKKDKLSIQELLELGEKGNDIKLAKVIDDKLIIDE